ncbi:hypothetical protein LMG22037_05523 [Paraburkholderia phenoliruptrix]|jgi:transcriptional regulator with XRE-family HTH domain|uniref:HTH cro/C1-type domain-containing protein n=1 Tax=Paraburkholderia phenoliruptrix TaxID=252970 RepID=A0A6J5C8D2_9BURK|nr:helix-turn-helix transcriptional regulator [Paraburkholderia phenoliruptrix]CAB3730352.1 hypothetical protein LMG22037_05523 [Paraburkholderia phenoliruptrix]
MTVAGILKARREELGLTLRGGASAAGSSKGHLQGSESGRYPNIRFATAVRLASVLQLGLLMMAGAVLAECDKQEDVP